jgi:hypothetical protein
MLPAQSCKEVFFKNLRILPNLKQYAHLAQYN